MFLTAENPVRVGLVASLARPGGNLTGINLSITELAAKRLELLRELVPGTARVAVLVNPANANAETTLRGAKDAGRAMGLQIRVLNASTSLEINAAFANLAQQRPDAVFVGGDAFFQQLLCPIGQSGVAPRPPRDICRPSFAGSRRPHELWKRLVDAWRQVGVYAGRILKGESLRTCLWCRRPSSNWSSMPRPPGCSTSRCRRRCSPRADEVIE